MPPVSAPPPAPGARLTVTLERPAALGRAVARVDGLTVLVARGLPGETVLVEVEQSFPRYALARVVDVLQPAPSRVEPPCAHFADCGGCDWQHLDYPGQLALKRAVLAEQLERIGRIAPPAEWSLVPAPKPLAYRDTLEFTPVAAGDRYAPGFHDPAGHTPVPIAHCRLAPESYTRLAQSVLDALTEAHLLPEPAGSAPLPLQRLTVQGTLLEGPPPQRQEQSALAVLLHLRATGRQSEGRLRRTWQQALRWMLPGLRARHPELVALALQYPARMGRGGPRRSGPTVEVLHGPARLLKRVHGRTYRVPHTAFFQVHPELAGALTAHVVEQAQQALTEAPADARARPVFDLFGGVGLFALPLAERGLRVLGVDSDREGLRAAEETARGLGLAGGAACTFQRGDLERAGTLQHLIAGHGAPGVVICDPPRRGLAAALTSALADLAPEQAPVAIVYVSCDGGTFARDAARLATAYELRTLRAFDLFPQTHHLELVGTFARRTDA